MTICRTVLLRGLIWRREANHRQERWLSGEQGVEGVITRKVRRIIMACVLGIEQSCSECRMCGERKDSNKITNADRIRNMTNEELAEFIHNICTDFEDGEPILTLCLGENCDIEISDSYGDIKEWLEGEAL